MKLKNNEATHYTLSDLRRQPAGPAHLAGLLKALEASANELPLDASPPSSVTKARLAFEAAVAFANQIAAKVEEAAAAAAAAGRADVAAAVKVAEAPGAGKLPEPTGSRKASAAVEAAMVNCEAAEKVVETAHDALIDSVQKAWPSWRAGIVKDAASAHAAAAKAMQEAASAVATARDLYAATGILDHQVLSRDAALQKAAHAEMRQGLPYFDATHTGRQPLQNVTLPHGKTPIILPVAVVVEALAAAVAEPPTFPAADWLPAADPARAELLAAPLDPAAPWVKAQVRREWGDVCVVCRLPQTDEAVEVVGAAWPWAMVHTKCKNKAPDPKEQKRAEREAKMQRDGFPADPQAGAWKAEKAKQGAENAHAAALGGLDDTGDPNAAMIAKHRHSDD